MASGSFATSVSCIDGRIQDPISGWIRTNHGVDFVDTVTEPGLDKRISEFPDIAEELRKKVVISIKAHKSRLVVVSGHADCAGNPVTDDEHRDHIRKGAEVVKSWNLGVDVVGVWVDHDWKVSPVC